MKRVIHPSELPTVLPINLTAIGWLLMDHFHASDFWFGVWWTFIVLLWLIAGFAIYTQKYTNVIR